MAQQAAADEADRLQHLEDIIRTDTDLMQVLTTASRSNLPQWRLGGGCVYQRVWNALTGRPGRTGVKDYDLVYFNAADLSWESEDKVARSITAALPDFHGVVEVRNHARVPLWFEQRFGFHCPAVAHPDDVFRQYPLTVQALGVRLEPDGFLNILAPFGLADLFALRIRPNRSLPNKTSYEEKTRRLIETWPELTVEPW
ncbi:nucleotidyltransferase family protein [Microvirga sp. CF3062]|uniref:nucleotidyltransferase family protein n=1 Tax=Microvirga sp. CF3062 TaxID=3110182 RepID=UPI002E766C43|nr:nucleotidyltransferase family protein [Microvirga sp. CF3062]MEE1655578.1 nucleotidyltransferase family protein [Microvirga sp. CF3062]